MGGRRRIAGRGALLLLAGVLLVLPPGGLLANHPVARSHEALAVTPAVPPVRELFDAAARPTSPQHLAEIREV
ncbi:MAG: hypothetical protein L3K09_09065, partial [Thermoplasmata archaeon]|nr:hypothetical protein [Thermoplasmata archaeon]